MLIQNEYCNGGTLSDVIADNYRRLSYLSELELKDLLLQVTRGLKYIHSTSLVHMDIKPSEYNNSNGANSNNNFGLYILPLIQEIMQIMHWSVDLCLYFLNPTADSLYSNVLWLKTYGDVYVFVPGNIFISRKSVSSCDECDEDEGLTTSVVYKIGKLLLLSHLV